MPPNPPAHSSREGESALSAESRIEQRSALRVAAGRDGLLRIGNASQDATLAVRTADLSLTGCRLTARRDRLPHPDALAPGRDCRLHLLLDGERIDAPAEVVWSQRAEPDGVVAGLRFGALGLDAGERLERFVLGRLRDHLPDDGASEPDAPPPAPSSTGADAGSAGPQHADGRRGVTHRQRQDEPGGTNGRNGENASSEPYERGEPDRRSGRNSDIGHSDRYEQYERNALSGPAGSASARGGALREPLACDATDAAGGEHRLQLVFAEGDRAIAAVRHSPGEADRPPPVGAVLDLQIHPPAWAPVRLRTLRCVGRVAALDGGEATVRFASAGHDIGGMIHRLLPPERPVGPRFAVDAWWIVLAVLIGLILLVIAYEG